MRYRIWNIEERTRSQVCLHFPHRHTHTLTQSRWTPGLSPETVQPHWAPCAFTDPVRDTPTISLVSLCVHRDVLQSHGDPSAFTGMHPHSRPQRKPLFNPFFSHLLSPQSDCFLHLIVLSILFSDRFCHIPWALFPHSFMMSLSGSV